MSRFRYPETTSKASLRELMSAPPTSEHVIKDIRKRQTQARRLIEERKDARLLGLGDIGATTSF